MIKDAYGICGLGQNRRTCVWFIKYILVFNLLIYENTSAHSHVCRRFKHAFGEVDNLETVQPIEGFTCPLTSSSFNVYRVSKLSDNADAGLLICWTDDIRRFAFHFDDSVQIVSSVDVNSSAIINANSRRHMRSCQKTNDTVLYKSNRHGGKKLYKLLLNIPTPSNTPVEFRAFYRYKGRERKFSHHKELHYTLAAESKSRKRRNTIPEPTITYSEPSTCGKTYGCFRNGEDGCDHFGCTYFLAYHVTKNSSVVMVDIEISAKTSGWVAVGFSSDTTMGDDEVVMCLKSMKPGSEVNYGTYKTPIYAKDRPSLKADSHVLTLVSSAVRDGYIYCHLKREISPDNHMDLTNDWHQLYAYGPLSSGGEIEKHGITPKVSRKKISLLRTPNILINASTNTCMSYLYLTLYICIAHLSSRHFN